MSIIHTTHIFTLTLWIIKYNRRAGSCLLFLDLAQPRVGDITALLSNSMKVLIWGQWTRGFSRSKTLIMGSVSECVPFRGLAACPWHSPAPHLCLLGKRRVIDGWRDGWIDKPPQKWLLVRTRQTIMHFQSFHRLRLPNKCLVQLFFCHH